MTILIMANEGRSLVCERLTGVHDNLEEGHGISSWLGDLSQIVDMDL